MNETGRALAPFWYWRSELRPDQRPSVRYEKTRSRRRVLLLWRWLVIYTFISFRQYLKKNVARIVKSPRVAHLLLRDLVSKSEPRSEVSRITPNIVEWIHSILRNNAWSSNTGQNNPVLSKKLANIFKRKDTGFI